jgi:FlaA1/EpsC-like NDP-sugar epimerase
MLELSGHTEDEIGIRFVGARAGEKLHEELWNAGEEVGPTSHPKIMRAARSPIDGAWLEERLDELAALVAEADTLGVVTKLRAMIAEPRRAGSAVLEDTLH